MNGEAFVTSTKALGYAQVGASTDLDESVNFHEIGERVKQILEPVIEESGALVTTGVLPTVKGSITGFVRVFQNIIGNAIKYKGGLPPRIHVSAERQDQDWCMTVSDNGMGIDPQYRERVFGVFNRLHGNEIPGTGIGLATFRRVVERWGGRIWVESDPAAAQSFALRAQCPKA